MRMNTRFLSLLLMFVLLVCSVGCAFAADSSAYMDAIESVMDTLKQNDASASNINHQIVNGRYRTVQMLEIIAYELDTTGVYGDAIESVMDNLRRNDASASNVNHQILNGAYRTVQLLEVIAYELDTKGIYGDYIESVMDTLRKNDSSASNINHQILNGTYRTVQMLEVIAYELDTNGVFADYISDVMDTLRKNDSSASNINQQIVNGAYRTVQMLEIIAYELNTGGNDVFSDAISSVMDNFRENDSSASNINHQHLNGVYRTVQMLEVIAYESIPEGAFVESHGKTRDKTDVDMIPDESVDNDI